MNGVLERILKTLEAKGMTEYQLCKKAGISSMGHAVTDITHSTYIKNDDAELLRTAIEKVDFLTYL